MITSNDADYMIFKKEVIQYLVTNKMKHTFNPEFVFHFCNKLAYVFATKNEPKKALIYVPETSVANKKVFSLRSTTHTKEEFAEEVKKYLNNNVNHTFNFENIEEYPDELAYFVKISEPKQKLTRVPETPNPRFGVDAFSLRSHVDTHSIDQFVTEVIKYLKENNVNHTFNPKKAVEFSDGELCYMVHVKSK